jgi:cysteinyl-tRNA synthetase
VPFDALHSAQRAVVRVPEEAARIYGYEYGEPAAGEVVLNGVHTYIEQLSGLDAATRAELLARVASELRSAAPPANAAAEPLLDLLLELRCDLRAAKQWALADKLRDAVVQLGYEVQDTATGSTWQPR